MRSQNPPMAPNTQEIISANLRAWSEMVKRDLEREREREIEHALAKAKARLNPEEAVE